MQLLRLRQIHNGVFIKVGALFSSTRVSSFSQQQAGVGAHSLPNTHQLCCSPHATCCLQINKATVNMLKRVEPYVAWGYPNLKTVKELIYKRGYGKVSRSPCQLAMGAALDSSCVARPECCLRGTPGPGQLFKLQGVLMALRPLCHQLCGQCYQCGRAWGGAAAVAVPSGPQQTASPSLLHF